MPYKVEHDRSKFVRKIIAGIFKLGARFFTGMGLSRIGIIRRLRDGSLEYLHRSVPESVGVGGGVLYLDADDNLELSIRGIYEPFETQIFKEYAKKGNTVLDIGAFIGYYTILAASIVGAHGKVLAFEPVPANFTLLQKNIKINNYGNVIPIQKAVSDKNGKFMTYFTPHKSPGIFFLASGALLKQEDAPLEVEAVTVDSLLPALGIEKVDFIKIDTEGWEDHAIQGMRETIKNNEHVVILCEFAPRPMIIDGRDPKKHLQVIRSLGFTIYGLNEREKTKEELSDDELIRFASISGRNLLCIK